jgi:hypothetical protein
MDSIPYKRCSKCGEVKPLTDYTPRPDRKSGYVSRCRACSVRLSQDYAARNREKVAARQSAHRKQHREQVNEQKRKTRAKNREHYRTYSRVTNREWNERNRERLNAKNRRWKQANPDSVKAAAQRRRALLRNSAEHHTPTEWRELKAHYGHRCLCCGAREGDVQLTPDHVLPLAVGGTNGISNIQPLCLPCNLRKGVQHIDYRPLDGPLLETGYFLVKD